MPSMTAVLRKFFGYREGEGLREFSAELKALTPEEKLELATLAARELNVPLDQDEDTKK